MPPLGIQAWDPHAPPTHPPRTQRCPHPAHRRPGGGSPVEDEQCTPPPKRGSGSSRWLLSCKRGVRLGLHMVGDLGIPHKYGYGHTQEDTHRRTDTVTNILLESTHASIPGMRGKCTQTHKPRQRSTPRPNLNTHQRCRQMQHSCRDPKCACMHACRHTRVCMRARTHTHTRPQLKKFTS